MTIEIVPGPVIAHRGARVGMLREARRMAVEAAEAARASLGNGAAWSIAVMPNTCRTSRCRPRWARCQAVQLAVYKTAALPTELHRRGLRAW